MKRMLTSSTVITEITQACLEIRRLVSAWLVGHSHDQDILCAMKKICH